MFWCSENTSHENFQPYFFSFCNTFCFAELGKKKKKSYLLKGSPIHSK